MRTPSRLLLPALVIVLALPATAAGAQDGFEVRDDVADADTSPDVRVRGGGWGHGVGMSQYGAYGMAQEGWGVEEILNYYYEGTHLTDAGALGLDVEDRPVHVGLLDAVEETVIEVPGDLDWVACDDDGCDRVDGPGAGTWRVSPSDDGLVVEERVEADGDGSDGDDAGEWEEREVHDASSLRVDLGADGDDHLRVHVDVGDGSTVTRTMARGVHRIVGLDDEELSTVQVLDDLETYLYGLAEMPSSWGAHGGEAALQAQAVTGRTYAAQRIGPDVDLAARDCRCHLQADARAQVYSGWDKEAETAGGQELGALWVAAVDATAGDLLADGQGGLAEAVYSSSHNARSESIEDSWAFGDTAVPYLRSVDDPWSDHPANPLRSWSAAVDNADLAALIDEGVDADLETVEHLQILSRTDGRTPVELAVRGRDADGEPVEATFRRPGEGKAIAGAHLRVALDGVEVTDADGRDADHLDTLPSSQIDAFAFEPFVDDEGREHEYAAAWAAAVGIAQGVEADRFAPQRPVTRGQMASFLYRAFDVPPAEERHFDDVGEGHEHGEAIDALGEAGVAEGRDDGTFAPGSTVTREQMASFLARVLGLEEVADDGRFDDLAGGVHDGSILAIAEEGVTRGCATSRFCPGDDVPREQMATFLLRAVRGAD